jgi:hypothetical protein
MAREERATPFRASERGLRVRFWGAVATLMGASPTPSGAVVGRGVHVGQGGVQVGGKGVGDAGGGGVGDAPRGGSEKVGAVGAMTP